MENDEIKRNEGVKFTGGYKVPQEDKKASQEARNSQKTYSVLHKCEWNGSMDEGVCGIWDGSEWIFEGTWEECFAKKHLLEVNYVAENYFLEN